jgi:TusA-related sulfurtransferase
MAEYFLDALGEMCPLPNIMVRERLSQIDVGDVLVIETDHYCAKLTIQKEMKRLGHHVRVAQVAPGIWQVTITKRG